MEKTIKHTKFIVIKDDITERKVEAIINPANSYLKHGGGVAGVIVRKGGIEIQKESDKIGYVPVGQVALTTAGNLPFKAIIHAVGPKMGEGNEDNKLRTAIKNILRIATDQGLKSIAIPAISTGIFGYPKDKCAKILVEESKKFILNSDKSTLNTIEFCTYDDETFRFFKEQLNELENTKTQI